MVTEATPGIGDVELELGGETITLRPSLNAAMKLSTRAGGISGLVQKCLNLDIEAISDVIIIGGGIKVQPDTKEKIFMQGLLDLSAPCIKYLNNLANGGKPLRSGEESEDDPLDQSSP